MQEECITNDASMSKGNGTHCRQDQAGRLLQDCMKELALKTMRMKPHQNTLQLGLAGLEVIATDEHIVLNGKVDETWHEGVLGGAVDEGHALQHTGCTVQAGRGHLQAH